MCSLRVVICWESVGGSSKDRKSGGRVSSRVSPLQYTVCGMADTDQSPGAARDVSHCDTHEHRADVPCLHVASFVVWRPGAELVCLQFPVPACSSAAQTADGRSATLADAFLPAPPRARAGHAPGSLRQPRAPATVRMPATGGVLRVTLSAFVFVFTGLVQTVCIQSVLYSGGGDRSTFLLAIPNYLGIILVYFLGTRVFRALDRLAVWSSSGVEANRVHHGLYNTVADPKKDTQDPQASLSFFARLFHRERRKLFVLAFNEMGGFLSGLTGLSIAGSGLYQVVFSGATVFTALLSTFFLRKRLSLGQWFFVAVITSGLMITAEQVTHTSTEAGAASLVSGVSFVLVSCLFYSTNYVIVEHFLGKEHADPADEEPTTLPPPTSLDLSLYTGGTCLFLFGIYVLTHTVPNWGALVTSSIEKHHGNTTLILEEYLYLTVASFFHAITHYDIVATVGAVPIGILNALRAVSVFGASSWLFCAHQASQCYSSRKGASTALVILGALGYSAASAAAAARKRAAGFARVNQAKPTRPPTRKPRRSTNGSGDIGHQRSKSVSLLEMYSRAHDDSPDRSSSGWFTVSKAGKGSPPLQSADGIS